MDSKKKNLTVCILFGLLLAVAFLACLFLPKEATSDSERRKLAAMPAFTLDTVLSGRFMSGFETYTQDHFPFRDQFRTLKALSGHRPVPPAGQQWDLCFRRLRRRGGIPPERVLPGPGGRPLPVPL